MLRLPKMRLGAALLAALLGVWPISLAAQQDPNDMPLGDVARTMRKKTTPAQDVIDNDNLSQVMEQVDSKRAAGSALKFLMARENQDVHISAPDATCSLSFTANTKALLSNQYAQMDLPATDVVKLSGPATIEGDAITVTLFNETEWHVSEIAVALTIVKTKAPPDLSSMLPAVNRTPFVALGLAQESDVRPEKKPDVTVIYRMRSAAPPWTTTVFSAPLDLEISAADEWHWALVQAKGYPPQNYSSTAPQTTAQTSEPANLKRPLPPASSFRQDSPIAPLLQKPQ